jgi:hypothetical protein
VVTETSLLKGTAGPTANRSGTEPREGVAEDPIPDDLHAALTRIHDPGTAHYYESSGEVMQPPGAQ